MSRTVPGANSSAGERRLVEVVAMLAERADVDLVTLGSDRPGDEPARIEALLDRGGVRVPYGGRPINLVRLLRGRSYGLIVIETWETAEAAIPVIRQHQAGAVVAVDTVDLHFLRDGRAAATTGRPDPDRASRASRELRAYGDADIRIFVSEEERELYESLHGAVMEHNTVIPIVVPSGAAAPRVPRGNEVVFVGPLWHFPNHDGVSWFCSEIWPRIRAAVPAAHLRVIGSNAWAKQLDVASFATHPGVTLTGFVPDIGSAYASASVVVAPLRFGAGMKGKVCEAMAAGVPVVTTTVGAEGIRAVAGRDLLVADDPAGFARSVVAVLQDSQLAGSIGRAGAAAVRLQCGIDIVRPTVHALLDEATWQGDSRLGLREMPRRLVAFGWRSTRRAQALRQQAPR